MSTSETTTQQYFFFKKKQYPIHLYISAPPGPYPIPTKPPKKSNLGIQETLLHKELKPWSPAAVGKILPSKKNTFESRIGPQLPQGVISDMYGYVI